MRAEFNLFVTMHIVTHNCCIVLLKFDLLQMGMFHRATAFNKDLSRWNVVNGQWFVGARRGRLVCYDAFYNSQLLYCIIYNSVRHRWVSIIAWQLLTKI